jgi:hypothetical protein
MAHDARVPPDLVARTGRLLPDFQNNFYFAIAKALNPISPYTP